MNPQMIYIIDDEQPTADLLGEFVALMGYKVKTYTKATLFFKENDACVENSLLIVDLNMPEMDGVEVMRRLAARGCTLPIVLMSGYDSGVLHSAEQLARAHSLKIIATLNKPFQFQDLKDVLQRYGQIEADEAPAYEKNMLPVTVSDLEDALLNKEFILHYQPQIDIESGSLSGVEALVRWQHPEYGLIYPDQFISLAEENGLISDLTGQIIKQAVEQTLNWKAENLIVQVSVNISAVTITSLTLPEQLIVMLDNNKLEASMLTLEVTESELVSELVTSLDILTRLRMKGIELSIDDFGTGHSSLSQLYRVPFTELKVDQSFVKCIVENDEARGIVKTCIMLGHELNMHVVAEGVENKETLALLSQMGCDIAQGYYIARPMLAEDLVQWQKSRRVYKNSRKAVS